MKRRELIRATGIAASIGVVGLAGCAGPGAQDGPAEEGTQTPMGEETETETEGAGAGTETETETPEGTETQTTMVDTATPGGGGGGVAQTFELGGKVEAWVGQAPDAISGQNNPTLELQAGQTYEVTWENLDGQPHNFVIEDDSGNRLVETELMQQQGETQTVEFTAESAMVSYFCEVHPNTMRGDVTVSGG